METDHKYRVDLKWKRDRLGEMTSPDLIETLEVATPPDFPEGMDGYWSPEHLFIASVSSCFMTTFLAIAGFSKLNYDSLEIKAGGVVTKAEKGYEVSEISLKPTLVIDHDDQKAKAERILHKSEQACLITNSIRTKVLMEPIIEIKALA